LPARLVRKSQGVSLSLLRAWLCISSGAAGPFGA